MDITQATTSATSGYAAGGPGPVSRQVVLGLTGRDRALLRAVAAGRCDLVTAVAPEMRVDGRWYCDQARAHDLVVAGLFTTPGGAGTGRGPAELTMAGRHALAG